MTLKVAVPATYQPGRHIIVPTADFFRPSGIVDAETGHEVSHAHHQAWLRQFLSEPLIRLIEHAAKHADDPTHQYHTDAAESFHGRVRGTWHIDRYDAPLEYYAAQASKGSLVQLTEKQLEADPTWIHAHPALYAEAMQRIARDKKNDSSEFEDTFDNVFCTNGVNALWSIANAGAGAANTGASPAAATALYNTTQSRIGVGDANDAGAYPPGTLAAAANTDLTATTNKLWVVVTGAPTITTNQMAFATSYTSANGNFNWYEFACDNCGGSNATGTTRSGGTMLDHVNSNQGTKASGQTWNPTLTLSVS